ncbi:MAG: UDP-N-acetylmuramoyl-tripeptide--D-alanyl-D-alanine ligase [Myxococcota bacterium]|nr:UDP-N-acetylmuramoyl-tripeptide--D-alanyl-D-alanine ligase [Myxococcota bacterium]
MNSAAFSLDELASAVRGRIAARSDRALIGVTTDSRAVRPGSVFVALRGEMHDGHDHVDAAMSAGAAAVVVSRPVAAIAGTSVVIVDDTLRALGDLASAHRQRFDVPVIGITGSAGKTTTKELTSAALESLGLRVHRTAGNLNNLIGVPMTLLGIDASHQAVVVEMGMNAPGEIVRLAEIARPTVGVVTSVAEVHTEGVGNLEGVAREKGALLEGLAADAIAVFTVDDTILGPHIARSAAGTKVSFGTVEDADVRLMEPGLEGERMRCTYVVRGLEEPVQVDLALLGEGPALSGAAALAVVLALRGAASTPAAAKGLTHVAPSPGRALPLPGPEGSLLLDDTYNASPRSIELALRTAAELAAKRGGRAIAVLGDMKELGPESERLHEEVGAAAVAAGVEILVCCGTDMRAAARGALAATTATGVSGVRIERLEDPLEAIALVRDAVASGDVVLVKGSRAMRMERVIEGLRVRAEPSAASPDGGASEDGSA